MSKKAQISSAPRTSFGEAVKDWDLRGPAAMEGPLQPLSTTPEEEASRLNELGVESAGIARDTLRPEHQG